MRRPPLPQTILASLLLLLYAAPLDTSGALWTRAEPPGHGFPSAHPGHARVCSRAGQMAWRVADAARTFDSLTRPTPSRVHGPTEPPEPDVPRGASALLGASPRELLSVAVARMVFRRMLAPGLIVTSARYVLRCAGVPAEPYLGSLASRHLLPATDHLSSLPRRYDHVGEIQFSQTDLGTDV